MRKRVSGRHRGFVQSPAGRRTPCPTNKTTLQSKPDEVRDGLDESNLQLYRWTGSEWEGYPSTADPTNNLVTAQGVTSLSRWLIGDRGNPPTAVTLRAFGAHSAPGATHFGSASHLLLALVALGLVSMLLWARRWR